MRLFLALTLCLVASTVAQAADKSCTGQCADKFSGKSAVDQKNSCQMGCRLLSLIEGVDLNPLDRDLQGTQANCDRSCESSYVKENDSKACKSGCALQVPISLQRRKEMAVDPFSSFFGPKSLFGDIFGSSFFGSQEQEKRSDGDQPESSMMPDFGQLFQSVHERMSNLMTSVMDQAKQIQEGGMIPFQGHGRLIVVKNGPGFHEEKTYNIGPDGVHEVKNMEKDMMAKPNPLEQFFNDNDVEIFKPMDNAEQKKKQKERKEGLERLHRLENRENFASVHGYDFDNELDGPNLPDTGLRQDIHAYPSRCSASSETMEWSEWISCLHARSGLPRWLTAATLSLGIIFVLWLCLVIPQTAPRQAAQGVVAKPVSPKALEAATKLEKEYLANITYPTDLPPSYDEVANLHVAVPEAVKAENDETTKASKA